MSSYYLCDTCAVQHWFSENYSLWLCSERDGVRERIVMTDEHERPHEVCPHWKPKEAE